MAKSSKGAPAPPRKAKASTPAKAAKAAPPAAPKKPMSAYNRFVSNFSKPYSGTNIVTAAAAAWQKAKRRSPAGEP